MKKFLLFALLGICFNAYPQSMQYPPSIEWFRIKTHFGEIIYPKPLSNDALRISRLLEAENAAMSKTMPTKIRKISILLNNQLSTSNGYVGLAPYKSVWYNTPPQTPFNGTLDWYESLAKHEFRHIYQFNRLNRNVNKVWYFLFGEYGQGAASGLTPNWFFEGDAVLSETLLSHSGRGRMAEFDMPIRTNYLNGIHYNYYKASLGSYKDYVANHYYYGYLYTTYLRRKLGAQGVDHVLEHTTKLGFWPFAFNQGLKRYTDKGWDKNFNEMISDVGKQWAERQSHLDTTAYQQLNRIKKTNYTSYTEPCYLPDSSILCKKNSRKEIQQWTIVKKDGTEMRLGACTAEGSYSLKGSTIVFDEEIPDVRWGEKSSSDIFSFDLKNKTKRRLTRHQRYYSPSFSPDGKRISVVEFDANNQSSCALIDSKTGKLLSKFQLPGHEAIRTPIWANDSSLVLVHSKLTGFAVSSFRLNGEKQRELIPCSSAVISQLSIAGKWLFYHSDETGIDNLFAINMADGQKYQIGSAAYGAFYPKANGNASKLVYQNYSAKGYNIAETTLDSSKWIRSDKIRKMPIFYFEPLLTESNPSDIKIDSSRNYKEEKYRAWTKPIGIHTWYLYHLDAEVYAGLISSNKLNTLSLNPSVTYNLNEKTFFGDINLQYAKHFLVLNSMLGYGSRTLSTLSSDGSTVYHSFNESNLQIGLELPLNFSRGAYTRTLNMKVADNITKRDAIDAVLAKSITIGNGQFNYLSASLVFSNLRKMAPRDIYPRLGQHIQLYGYHSPASSDYLADYKLIKSTFYFPGFASNHHIRINVDYEEQQKQKYFSSSLQIRGYEINYACDSKAKIGVNYALPLMFPDFALGQYFYLRRVALNLFSDIGQLTYPVRYYRNNVLMYTQSESKRLRSFGGELMFSFNLLNFPYPIHTGIRASYRQSDKTMFYEALPVSISF